MDLRSRIFFAGGSAFTAFHFVPAAHAGPIGTDVTIDLAACEMPSGNETICTSGFGIPDHAILPGEPLSIDFTLDGAGVAHLVAFNNVTWTFDLSFCCDEIQPNFTLTLSDLNGDIPGFVGIPPDNASTCELSGNCTFTVPIPGLTSIYGLNFPSLYEQRESVTQSLRIVTEGSDHFAIPDSIPEPGTGVLFLLALAGVAFRRLIKG